MFYPIFGVYFKLGVISSMVTREHRKLRNQKYREMSTIVARVIAEWDPYALLAEGAPRYEFDAEVASVVAQIPRIASATDATQVVSRVFSTSFEPDVFTLKVCAKVGKRLFAELETHGFLA